jgi:DNA-binding HxlR family transcriptional regulator
METVSLANILSAISNENALAVFKTIADTKGDTDVLRTKLNISRKQYYSRMSGLLKAGLVKRKNGRYSLTIFGELVYDAAMTLEKAFNNNNYWKLKAIDSFEIAPGQGQGHELSIEERNKIIDTLLRDDQKIKDILLTKRAS